MKMLIIPIMFSLLLVLAASAYAEQDKWEGVDKTVIEKTAGESGRQAVDTPFNSLEGDALLLAFLLGGAAGGFAAGYYYRKLTERRPGDE